MTFHNDPEPSVTRVTKPYDNNRIAIWSVLGLVVLGGLYYGYNNYIAPPAPVARTAAPAPAAEPVGQGPGTPGRP